jgi:hypothetical protein
MPMNPGALRTLTRLVLDHFAEANLMFADADTELLISDLAELTQEPRWEIVPFADAYKEWIRRIGGTDNLPAYLASLQAGERLRKSPRIIRL